MEELNGILTKVISNQDDSLRPIHYLGSKLRILEFIKENIDSLDPSCGRLCDLFAGSGTVSNFFSKTRDVTSVDIQEFSRILCSAVLLPARLLEEPQSFVEKVEKSESLKVLLDVFEDLLYYEDKAVTKASSGNLEPLYDIIEHGSIIAFEIGQAYDGNERLKTALEKSVQRIKKHNMQHNPLAMVTRYFGGLYFSYRQAIWIDATLEEVFIYTNSNSNLRDMMLAAIVSTASDIVNTVGKQFAQPLQVRASNGTLKNNLLGKILKDRSLSFIDTFKKWLYRYSSQQMTKNDHQILKMDYVDALEKLKYSDTSIVYADPPYTRYHYSRYYHVLETICLRDVPQVSTTFPNGKTLSRGVYRADRHQSPFSIQSKAAVAFDKLFDGVAQLKVPFVLSYSPFSNKQSSTPRMQTIEQLITIGKRYYKSVSVISPGNFTHSKLNSIDKNFASDHDAETLILCK